jgi:hypothetical protein
MTVQLGSEKEGCRMITKKFKRKLTKSPYDRYDECLFHNEAAIKVRMGHDRAKITITEGTNTFDERALKELIAELLFIVEDMEEAAKVRLGVLVRGLEEHAEGLGRGEVVEDEAFHEVEGQVGVAPWRPALR